MKKSKTKRPVPHSFLLDHLVQRDVIVKPMFGHHAVYVEGILMLFLIGERGKNNAGVCLATTPESFEQLKKVFPNGTFLPEYGPKAKDWMLLPLSAPDFEESVVTACELVVKADKRIGRLPKK